MKEKSRDNKGEKNPMYGKNHSAESRKKMSESHKGRPLSEECKRNLSKSLKGKNTWMLGRKLSEETKKKMSKASLGRKKSEEMKKRLSIARKGMIFSEETLLKMSEGMRGVQAGSKHWNWKGGVSTERDRVSVTKAYKDWKLAVFNRDNFTCVRCGYEKGNVLQSHHIKSFVDFPELRFDVDNGVTLCRYCHAKVHPQIKNFILSAKKVDPESIIGKMTEGA